MAFANLFSSPPGEVDFNALASTHHKKFRSDQPYQNPKRHYETPRNTNPKKRRRKNNVSRGDVRKGYESEKERGHRMGPFKYEEEQANVHQKPSQCHINKETKLPGTPQSSLGPSSEGHQKNGQRVNKRMLFAKNNMHRTNMNEDVHKRQGRDTNSGKGCVFDDKKRAKMSKQSHQNYSFNQRSEAGSKKGRDKWQTGRHRPQREERKPFMTQEFKEQNSIDVNGRLFCKHFLGDRCLKGDQCQFVHSHDLGGFKFNGVCKFYVQGCCLKGDNCLFMHKTFPCKFFHTGRKCYQDNSCKFSHDALTELTKGLLDKFLEEQKVARETLEPETQQPEPKPALDFATNPVKLSFYSTAPAPEQLPVCRFSFGAKDSEFTPASTAQAAPSTPQTAPPPDTLPAQTRPPMSSLFSSTPSPVSRPVCRFSFGANNADFTPDPPSSVRQPGPSPAKTDPAASAGPDPVPNSRTPLSASPPSPSPAQPGGPSATISSLPSGAGDGPMVKTEMPSSPTPPGPTPSVLRTLFTPLSPCRPDDEEEEDLEMGCSQDAGRSCTDAAPRLCTKDISKVKEESGSHTEAPLVAPDQVLTLKAEPDLVKEMKKEEEEREPPTAPLKPVHCSTPTIPLKPVPCFTSTAPLKRVPCSTPTAPLKRVPCSTPITNPRKSYRPLTVDPPLLPFTAYHAQPPPSTSPRDVSAKALTPSVDSNSQSAVRRRAPLRPGAGMCTTQAESQGRHSLPVQTLTWSVPSTHSVSRSALQNRSLNSELDP
ncbi:zinc finger CCCH domain-containing protein 6-like [Alosa alosa]|uniref:zinc finger CCCH domain-containing protein 6-like n=1 Tax=Alosa alosa TaxID=278164 RepID=UPI0020153C4A|nr:zinc finger CCCH domain-containing protein 6-like [Alosa alosa]